MCFPQGGDVVKIEEVVAGRENVAEGFAAEDEKDEKDVVFEEGKVREMWKVHLYGLG